MLVITTNQLTLFEIRKLYIDLLLVNIFLVRLFQLKPIEVIHYGL